MFVYKVDLQIDAPIKDHTSNLSVALCQCWNIGK